MAVSLDATYRLIDRASPTLRGIERRAQAADRALDKLGRTIDRIAAKSAVSKLSGLNNEMGKLETSTNRVERVMAKTGVTQRGLNKELDNTSTRTRKVTGDWGRLETVMRKVLVVTGGLARVLAPAKFALIAVAIAPIAGALSAVGAGAVALVQQVGSATGAVIPLVARLGDLAGAGAAAATVLLSVKAAALVTKFAMSGTQQAIQGNVNAFKQLTPQAKAFVLEMRKLQPVLNTIRTSAQKGIFPGLTGAIKTARSNGAFQAANQAAGGLGSAVGGVTQSAVSQLTSPGVLRDLISLSGTADVIITKLGGAATNLAQAFIGILAAAQPLTRWLVSTISGWAKYLEQQVEVARETGALSRYFSETRTTLTRLGRAVRDFGMGFITIMQVARGTTTSFGTGLDDIAKKFRSWTENFNNQARVALWFDRARDSAHRLGLILLDVGKIFSGLGRASQGLGKSMTGGILQTLDRWSAFVNSFRGQNALNKWFTDSQATLSALAGLIGDVGKGFAALGANGGGAVPLIDKIRSLVPDLVRVLQSISANVGPGLLTTVQQLAHLLATISAAGGSPLGMMLNLTASILTNVNRLLDRFHAVRFAVALAVTAIGGAILLRKLGQIVLGVDGIAAGWRRVTGSTQGATLAAAEYDAVSRGGGPMAINPGAMGRRAGSSTGTTTAPGGIVNTAEKAGRFSRFGSLGLGVGLPIVAGVGAQLLQGNGSISSGTANRITGAASGASTGALIGSFIEPGGGTLVGAGIGAGAGLLLSGAGGNGPSPTQRYLASLQRTAGAQGFNVGAVQGGAQDITQANRYQRVLDQSLTRLRSQRSTLQKNTSGGLAGQGVQAAIGGIDQQIAANQKLRGENIARLGVERATLRAQQAQTAELQKQARIRGSRAAAVGIASDAGNAYNVLRRGGVSVQDAFAQVSRQTEAKIGNLKTPEGKLALANQLHNWQQQVVSKYGATMPGLADVLGQTTADTKKKLDKVGLVWVASATTSSQATIGIYQKLKAQMSSQAEQALEQVSAKFTSFQQRMIQQLVGLGFSNAQATAVVAGADAKGVSTLPSYTKTKYSRKNDPMAPKAATNPFNFSNPLTGATGMRIPGQGLRDTVPVGGASGIGAPGELIVNRHTEARVNRALAPAGRTLGGMVAGETKRHSDILPGYALGGRVGAAVGEANRIASLRSTYLFGGGHSTPAPGIPPWDCSSSTSRVLQAAGYNIPTMTAQQFMSWGEPGPGAIGVEASPGHVYMMLNGRPWGTSYSNYKGGPGWIHNGTGYRPGFVKRHAPNATAGSAIAAAGKKRGGAHQVALAFQGLLGGPTSSVGAAATLNPAFSGGAGGSGSQNQTLAHAMMLSAGMNAGQWPFLQKLWTRESGFSTTAKNPSSGAYGIPQSLPASKMASAGSDYLTNPRTQIKWGLDYIGGRYGTPEAAWAHETASNWYDKGGRIAWGGWHAGGLDRTFDRPTMIGVGENGSEHVKVTPNASVTRGSGGIHVTVGDIHIHGGTNASASDIKRELDHWAEDFARLLERQAIVGGP